MEQNQSNNTDTEERSSCGKSCLVSVIVILLIVACIAWVIQAVTNTNNTDTPTLLSRKATTNDLYIETNERNLTSIEIVVKPKYDIDNLEITIYYYNNSDQLLTSTTKRFGDVKKDGRYTEQVYLTDFSISQIFTIEYCQYAVTGGTVSYFS